MREQRTLEGKINFTSGCSDWRQGNQDVETIHVYIVREDDAESAEDRKVIDSTLSEVEAKPYGIRAIPAEDKTPLHPLLVVFTCVVGVCLTFAYLAMLFLVSSSVPIATVTLVPLMRQISITATITAVPGKPAIGEIKDRLLPTLTLSQSQTAAVTGKGHQDAQQATGTITFFNGLFASQTVPAGTILTGRDGVQVVTDQAAIIPPGNPPAYGQVAVSAHAVRPGFQGNIPVRDINQACCLTSILAENLTAFQGGQNARAYTYVTGEDRERLEASLTATLAQSVRAAFEAQLTSGEALIPPTCTPTVAADHQVGAEAPTVTVTVSERCTAVAYDAWALQKQAVQRFMSEPMLLAGTHYRLIGKVQVSALHATITDWQRTIASIAVKIEGTWTYQFSQQELQRMKQFIAGKRQQDALRALSVLPGVKQATIEWIGGIRNLPKDSSRIRIHIVYREAQVRGSSAMIIQLDKGSNACSSRLPACEHLLTARE